MRSRFQSFSALVILDLPQQFADISDKNMKNLKNLKQLYKKLLCHVKFVLAARFLQLPFDPANWEYNGAFF